MLAQQSHRLKRLFALSSFYGAKATTIRLFVDISLTAYCRYLDFNRRQREIMIEISYVHKLSNNIFGPKWLAGRAIIERGRECPGRPSH